ncbi:MAG: sigma-70 family RNA polymerase sigma factor [Planctomycetes bacterium]|nr:sigma-70 family RNA polymerase sigma factor [Planctomycetota bacterium]
MTQDDNARTHGTALSIRRADVELSMLHAETSPLTDSAERELVRAAQSGDRAAFETLFDRVLPRVRTMAIFGIGERLRSRIETDDAVQEIFTEALKLLPQFQPDREGSFFGWLREIARHRLLALADRELGRGKRDPRREARMPDSTTAFSLLPPATVTSPTGAVLRTERLELLHRAMLRLSEEHRKIIILRCIEGRSTAEAAKELNKTGNATSVLLYRALSKLREAYEIEEGS